MIDSKNTLSGKRSYFYGFMLLLCGFGIFAAFSMADNDDFDTARQEVLLRKIGHELLLQAGDSTSRVLPVRKIGEDEFQISFANEFSFKADSLVNTTKRLLAKDPLASDYVVSVLNCSNASVSFGYAISKNDKEDIVACLGRIQPKACYLINIKFKSSGIHSSKTGYLLGSLPFLAFVGFIVLRSVRPRKPLPDLPLDGILKIGSMLFDVNNRKLLLKENTIDLTDTETRVLRVFALDPNETIQRSRLQKEIWEDEGVIVGRSLDMFISKLRKKLEIDPTVKIVVIRGKGYRLETGA